MRLFWTLLFACVPVLGVGAFVWTWLTPGGWVPISQSAMGDSILWLFYVILAITGIVFVGVEVMLVYAMYTGQGKADGRAAYIHGNHKLEISWTLFTAGILLFIAFYQVPIWDRAKQPRQFFAAARESFSKFDASRSSAGFSDIGGDASGGKGGAGVKNPGKHPHALVTASQFLWQVRYPAWKGLEPLAGGKDLGFRAIDSVNPSLGETFELNNELHVPAGEPIIVHLRSIDVLHSFWIPNAYVKQDTLPGHIIPVWFEFRDKGEYEWVCAELCGWGHYAMRAKVIVHKDRTEYEDWLRQRTVQQLGYKDLQEYRAAHAKKYGAGP